MNIGHEIAKEDWFPRFGSILTATLEKMKPESKVLELSDGQKQPWSAHVNRIRKVPQSGHIPLTPSPQLLNRYLD